MSVILRDYQEDMIVRAREKMRRKRRILYQLPTGGGKTAIAAFMIAEAVAKGKTVWFICHRAELVAGTSATLRKYGVPHGIIAAGYPMDTRQQVQVCSIDTLKNRMHQLAHPDLIIWDECHHIAAAGWAGVMAAYPRAFHIGLSATPVRLDGKGLDEHFDEMICGPSMGWLMDHGHLARYRLFAPGAPDMKGVRKALGDFSKGATAERADKPKLIGDAVKHWTAQAFGMRTVAFGVNRAHSLHIAEMFTAAGIPFAHLDGDTDKGERKRIITEFADGRILGLSNVGLFGEGFDLAAIAQRDVTIDCVVDCAPTMSLSSYMQRGGRMLRPADGKTGVYLDHAGNSARHGFFEDEREWSLESGCKPAGGGGDNDNGPPPPKTCSGCFMQIRQPAPPACPHCGAELRAAPKAIEVEAGELTEVSPEDRKRQRNQNKREQAECKTLGELVALGARRGYKSPQQWAYKIWRGRMARRPAVA